MGAYFGYALTRFFNGGLPASAQYVIIPVDHYRSEWNVAHQTFSPTPSTAIPQSCRVFFGENAASWFVPAQNVQLQTLIQGQRLIARLMCSDVELPDVAPNQRISAIVVAVQEGAQHTMLCIIDRNVAAGSPANNLPIVIGENPQTILLRFSQSNHGLVGVGAESDLATP